MRRKSRRIQRVSARDRDTIDKNNEQDGFTGRGKIDSIDSFQILEFDTLDDMILYDSEAGKMGIKCLASFNEFKRPFQGFSSEECEASRLYFNNYRALQCQLVHSEVSPESTNIFRNSELPIEVPSSSQCDSSHLHQSSKESSRNDIISSIPYMFKCNNHPEICNSPKICADAASGKFNLYIKITVGRGKVISKLGSRYVDKLCDAQFVDETLAFIAASAVHSTPVTILSPAYKELINDYQFGPQIDLILRQMEDIREPFAGKSYVESSTSVNSHPPTSNNSLNSQNASQEPTVVGLMERPSSRNKTAIVDLTSAAQLEIPSEETISTHRMSPQKDECSSPSASKKKKLMIVTDLLAELVSNFKLPENAVQSRNNVHLHTKQPVTSSSIVEPQIDSTLEQVGDNSDPCTGKGDVKLSTPANSHSSSSKEPLNCLEASQGHIFVDLMERPSSINEAVFVDHICATQQEIPSVGTVLTHRRPAQKRKCSSQTASPHKKLKVVTDLLAVSASNINLAESKVPLCPPSITNEDSNLPTEVPEMSPVFQTQIDLTMDQMDDHNEIPTRKSNFESSVSAKIQPPSSNQLLNIQEATAVDQMRRPGNIYETVVVDLTSAAQPGNPSLETSVAHGNSWPKGKCSSPTTQPKKKLKIVTDLLDALVSNLQLPENEVQKHPLLCTSDDSNLPTKVPVTSSPKFEPQMDLTFEHIADNIEKFTGKSYVAAITPANTPALSSNAVVSSKEASQEPKLVEWGERGTSVHEPIWDLTSPAQLEIPSLETHVAHSMSSPTIVSPKKLKVINNQLAAPVRNFKLLENEVQLHHLLSTYEDSNLSTKVLVTSSPKFEPLIDLTLEKADDSMELFPGKSYVEPTPSVKSQPPSSNGPLSGQKASQEPACVDWVVRGSSVHEAVVDLTSSAQQEIPSLQTYVAHSMSPPTTLSPEKLQIIHNHLAAPVSNLKLPENEVQLRPLLSTNEHYNLPTKVLVTSSSKFEPLIDLTLEKADVSMEQFPGKSYVEPSPPVKSQPQSSNGPLSGQKASQERTGVDWVERGSSVHETVVDLTSSVQLEIPSLQTHVAHSMSPKTTLSPKKLEVINNHLAAHVSNFKHPENDTQLSPQLSTNEDSNLPIKVLVTSSPKFEPQIDLTLEQVDDNVEQFSGKSYVELSPPATREPQSSNKLVSCQEASQEPKFVDWGERGSSVHETVVDVTSAAQLEIPYHDTYVTPRISSPTTVSPKKLKVISNHLAVPVSNFILPENEVLLRPLLSTNEDTNLPTKLPVTSSPKFEPQKDLTFEPIDDDIEQFTEKSDVEAITPANTPALSTNAFVSSLVASQEPKFEELGEREISANEPVVDLTSPAQLEIPSLETHVAHRRSSPTTVSPKKLKVINNQLAAPVRNFKLLEKEVRLRNLLSTNEDSNLPTNLLVTSSSKFKPQIDLTLEQADENMEQFSGKNFVEPSPPVKGQTQSSNGPLSGQKASQEPACVDWVERESCVHETVVDLTSFVRLKIPSLQTHVAHSMSPKTTLSPKKLEVINNHLAAPVSNFKHPENEIQLSPQLSTNEDSNLPKKVLVTSSPKFEPQIDLTLEQVDDNVEPFSGKSYVELSPPATRQPPSSNKLESSQEASQEPKFLDWGERGSSVHETVVDLTDAALLEIPSLDTQVSRRRSSPTTVSPKKLKVIDNQLAAPVSNFKLPENDVQLHPLLSTNEDSIVPTEVSTSSLTTAKDSQTKILSEMTSYFNLLPTSSHSMFEHQIVKESVTSCKDEVLSVFLFKEGGEEEFGNDEKKPICSGHITMSTKQNSSGWCCKNQNPFNPSINPKSLSVNASEEMVDKDFVDLTSNDDEPGENFPKVNECPKHPPAQSDEVFTDTSNQEHKAESHIDLALMCHDYPRFGYLLIEKSQHHITLIDASIPQTPLRFDSLTLLNIFLNKQLRKIQKVSTLNIRRRCLKWVIVTPGILEVTKVRPFNPDYWLYPQRFIITDIGPIEVRFIRPPSSRCVSVASRQNNGEPTTTHTTKKIVSTKSKPQQLNGISHCTQQPTIVLNKSFSFHSKLPLLNGESAVESRVPRGRISFKSGLIKEAQPVKKAFFFQKNPSAVSLGQALKQNARSIRMPTIRQLPSGSVPHKTPVTKVAVAISQSNKCGIYPLNAQLQSIKTVPKFITMRK